MKKSILAVAVAVCVSAPAIAMADATLYGHVTVAVDKVKDTKLNIGGDANSTSRIGLRGTADTGIDGVTALYQYEFAVNKTNGEQALKTRQANVGLTGGFGTVKAGTQSTPQDSWVNGTTDVMLSSIYEVTHSTGTAPSRINNSLAYVSPEFSGFQFALATAANSGNDDENLDLYHAAVKYSNAGFYGALGYIDYNSEAAFADKQSEMAIALEYDFGVGTIAGVYSHVKNDIADDYKPWDIAATYNVSESTTLKAAYADFKEGAKGFGVEVQHDLSKMVNLFAGYADANEDLGDGDVFSTGIRVRF
ncbi:hypothetical protein LH51_01435 [Nitrincola sp. A-D6]|uniref:porin n=1 Tax=Nitrincola sp. A-D6 TaxID=1545442 RepID=UPI00051F97E7|nr:porin [Nitrincola sp. A-D6]KGK43203.1 hypothetical protein LH51_01435 [Nitrincola sp. A-D6]